MYWYYFPLKKGQGVWETIKKGKQLKDETGI
jgi:hypothetical protein